MQSRQFILDFDGERITGENPFAVFESKNGTFTWREFGRSPTEFPLHRRQPNSVLQALKFAFDRAQIVVNSPTGGAIGFISYDFARQLEPRAFGSSPPDDLQIPDIRLTFFEHIERSAVRDQQPASIGTNLKPQNPKPEYLAAVAQIQNYIAAGDIYQANLTQRFKAPLHYSPRQLYEQLNTLNVAPFSALLEWDDLAIVSNSPERFLRLIGREVLAQPIKGTIRRGQTSQEDEKLRHELENSAKNRAENVMIVDLLRNDLGRVCEFGSVKVSKLCAVQTIPTLHHLVSDVNATLRADCDGLDLINACFPCGSITGAPKIRAMQIIDELEPVRRGVAMGAIGYIGFNGDMEWNVAIRTVTCKNDTAYFHVGGGIVADSEAQSEHDEVMLKAQALMAALNYL
ncbi:MAG TPA: aminodeoxychorismate synthase component I [Abditibacteriaceae bacterium]|jgi:para-aminobenzoate synthetase component 1